jgi:hypothetical protein
MGKQRMVSWMLPIVGVGPEQAWRRTGLTWNRQAAKSQRAQALSGNVFSNVNLNAGTRSLLCRPKKLLGYRLVHVLLSAIGADTCRDTLHHKRDRVAFQRDRSLARQYLCLLADDALHGFLSCGSAALWCRRLACFIREWNAFVL